MGLCIIQTSENSAYPLVINLPCKTGNQQAIKPILRLKPSKNLFLIL